jgi:hypothetical protein
MHHVPSYIFGFMGWLYSMDMHSDRSFVIPLNHLRLKLLFLKQASNAFRLWWPAFKFHTDGSNHSLPCDYSSGKLLDIDTMIPKLWHQANGISQTCFWDQI